MNAINFMSNHANKYVAQPSDCFVLKGRFNNYNLYKRSQIIISTGILGIRLTG